MQSTQLEVFDGPEMVGGGREWESREWFPPGPQLAVCLSGGRRQLADLNDDELLQVAAAARRQTSWAQARELAAIAELTRRRDAAGEADDGSDYRTLSAHEAVTEEVAAALTVTGNTAATLVHLAERLTGPLSATGEALESGRIDMAKARVISDTTENLPDQVTERVEAAALEKASSQTTGQLRRRIRRIIHRLAPEAMEQRKREAARQRRLEVWDTPSGTADLALCDIAAEDAHGIYNKITAAAHGLKADGDTRPLHLIRADLATNLLNGAPLPEATAKVLAEAVPSGPAHLTEVTPRTADPADSHLFDSSVHTTARSHRATDTPTDLIATSPPAAVMDQGTSVPVLEPIAGSSSPSCEVEAVPSVARERSVDVSDRASGHRRLAAVPSPSDSAASDLGLLAGNGDDFAGAGGLSAPARDRVPARPRLSSKGGWSALQTVSAATSRSLSRVRERGSTAEHQLPGQVVCSATVADDRASECTADASTGHRTSAGENKAVSPSSRAMDADSPGWGQERGRAVVHRLPVRVLRSVANLRSVECDGRDHLMAVAGARVRPEDDESGLSVAGVVAMIDRRLAHLRSRTTGAELPSAVNLAVQQLTRRLAPQRDALCQGDAEQHGRPGYRPPASLRREIEKRHSTCVFPTCNRASHRCDLDHTVPWRPGLTCRCNLAPLCRRHHRLKQSPGWNLHHVWPGVLVWTTPAGTWYIVRPDRE